MNFGKLNHATREVIRIKAIESIVTQGMSQIEASRVFGVGAVSVNRWMSRYRKEGKKALRTKPIGRPKETSKLKPLECAWIVRMITDKMPEQLKLPFYLWTTTAVRELIAKKFKIKLSRWTVGRMLKRWGLTPQVPVKKSYFQNDLKVNQWLKTTYPMIKRKAMKENATLGWLDEMGARSDDQVGRTYGRKGQTPTLKVSGNRFRCHMISSITNQGQIEFMMFTERFTQDVYLKFLERMTYRKKKKVFLITDSHPVHKGKRVQAWLSGNKSKIKVFYLPGYSPELNPAEYLNHDVKANAVRRKRAKDQPEMVNNITTFLKNKKKQPQSIKAYFQAKHVKYAA